MTDDSFIARWSRRKREAEAEREKPRPSAERADQAAVPPDANVPPTAQSRREAAPPAAECVPAAPESKPAVDLTDLPTIESITAETDIRAFLAPGVPPELKRAALRRVWATDPKIRDFVGLSENAWDFNAPDAVPGFGPLEMTDELRRLVDYIVGGNQPAATPARVSAPLDRPSDAHPIEAAKEFEPLESEPPAADRNEPADRGQADKGADAGDDAPVGLVASKPSAIREPYVPAPTAMVRRTHGGALPK
jgi:hypothetical protein